MTTRTKWYMQWQGLMFSIRAVCFFCNLCFRYGLSVFSATYVFDTGCLFSLQLMFSIRAVCFLCNLRGQSKKIPNIFFNLLLYLQLNQTYLLQSTPLYCWYTAPSVFPSSGTRPGTCYAGWRKGPVANFLLSPLPSEIGDLLGWTSTLGTGKSPQVPNLESRGAGARQSSLASPKIHG